MKLIFLIIGLVSLFFTVKYGRENHIIKAYKTLTGKREQEEMLMIRQQESKDTLIGGTDILAKNSKKKRKKSDSSTASVTETTPSTDKISFVDESFDKARQKHNEKLESSNSESWIDTKQEEGATGVLEHDYEAEPEGFVETVQELNSDVLRQFENPQYDIEVGSNQDDEIPLEQTTFLEEEEEEDDETYEFDLREVEKETEQDATDYVSDGTETSVLIDDEELLELETSDNTGYMENGDLEIEQVNIIEARRMGAYKRLKETFNND